MWGADVAFVSPARPEDMDWSQYYPAFKAAEATVTAPESGSSSSNHHRTTQDVEVADLGCGFGGLLIALGPKFPNTLFLGIFRTMCPSLGEEGRGSGRDRADWQLKTCRSRDPHAGGRLRAREDPYPTGQA